MGAWYCTREDVKTALDSKATARNNAQVDRKIAAATKVIDNLTHRGGFRPVTGTRFKDWPNEQTARPWRLWLDADEVIEVDTLTAGGIVIPSTDYFLEPSNDGPPFDRIEIDRSSSSSWSSGPTRQRSIEITGLFGYGNDEEPVGALVDNLDGTPSATASIAWSTARVGVGDVLRIGDERMTVRERTMVDSTQDIAADLASSAAVVTVAVANGAAFAVDQTLLVDSERMLIVDIAGNNLTVKRAWDGSVLAAHTTGAPVWTLTGIDIDRAQLGTTIAAHLAGAVIYRHLVPPEIRDLAIAEAINGLQQESSGYARSVRSGEGTTEIGGVGLADLRAQVKKAYGRGPRARAV
jgi:hypothetical protein